MSKRANHAHTHPCWRQGCDMAAICHRRDCHKSGGYCRAHKPLPEVATVRCPDHRNGGATSCPRGGAALQIWQRRQWGD
jgi:hypothetical protein